MKIAFITEGGYSGKISRDNPNMRTDQAWICALDAVHYPINQLPTKHQDVAIVIVPKEKNREYLAQIDFPLVQKVKEVADRVYVMQESTHWDWQDEPYPAMVWYYQQLYAADAVLCHNDIDVPYFTGITGKQAKVLPTLMITDVVSQASEREDKVFVAGNWHTTYRGFDAWVIGSSFELPMVGFKSGKFKAGEENNGVNYLPWMVWKDFMYELSKCKYGVQTYQASAGQFPLNCAYLGVPCIGYNDINTQRDLFPELSVRRGDVLEARKLASKLQTDKVFYDECSTKAKELYQELYSEEVFLKQIEL